MHLANRTFVSRLTNITTNLLARSCILEILVSDSAFRSDIRSSHVTPRIEAFRDCLLILTRVLMPSDTSTRYFMSTFTRCLDQHFDVDAIVHRVFVTKHRQMHRMATQFQLRCGGHFDEGTSSSSASQRHSKGPSTGVRPPRPRTEVGRGHSAKKLSVARRTVYKASQGAEMTARSRCEFYILIKSVEQRLRESSLQGQKFS